jgi:predicted nucleic acid-binding protein
VKPRLVCDASALVAALLDSGGTGRWVAERLAGVDVYAPALMPFECANIIRRHELAEMISADQAAQAHNDLLDLPLELWPYEAMATRVWRLRANLSAYDASYVAMAEAIDAPLLTLDRRLSRAPNMLCRIEVPPRE